MIRQNNRLAYIPVIGIDCDSSTTIPIGGEFILEGHTYKVFKIDDSRFHCAECICSILDSDEMCAKCPTCTGMKRNDKNDVCFKLVIND